MDISQVLVMAMSQMLPRLPLFVAWIVAVLLAVLRWKQHPRVSMLVVAAVAVLALETIVNAFVVTSMPMMMRSSGTSLASMGVFMAVYSTVSNVIAAGAWGMMIAAAFGWRSTQPTSASV